MTHAHVVAVKSIKNVVANYHKGVDGLIDINDLKTRLDHARETLEKLGDSL